MKYTVRTRFYGGLGALVLVALFGVLSVVSIMPPAPRTDTGSVGKFVAARAQQDIDVISQDVHVAGSEAAAEVRNYIMSSLREVGLSPVVHEGIASSDALGSRAVGHVQNVIAELPGSDPSGRLILMAHYDSVQVSHGANDDGSGVATLLEVARSLTSWPQMRNDVVLLFTDAEEACLCGAASFVESDRLGADGGIVLNFEARGANGPSIMFETSGGNSALVAEYAAAVPHPVATSVAVEVYRILPNDTDFTPFLDSGRFTGLNSAYIDGVAAYHTPQDSAANVHPGTLQQHGDNALALAQHLGEVDLAPLSTPATADATYFPVLGSLVRYSGVAVWIVAVLALGGFIAFGEVLRRRERASWGSMAGAVALMAVPLVIAGAVAYGYWLLLTVLRSGYASMLDPWRPGWYRLALCALVVAVVVGWYTIWRGRMGPRVLAAGSAGLLALLGAALAVLAPGGSYLTALPALFIAAAGITAALVPIWWVRIAAAATGGILVTVILAPTVALFFPALGLSTGAAAAIIAALLCLGLLPVFEFVHPAMGEEREELAGVRTGRRRHRHGGDVSLRTAGTSVISSVLALILTGVGYLGDGFDRDHPEPTQLMYAMDADTGDAYWVTEQTSPNEWLDGFVDAPRDLAGQFSFLDNGLRSGRAEAADLGSANVLVYDDTVVDGDRVVTAIVIPRPGARLVQVDVANSPLRAVTVRAGSSGREVPLHGESLSMLFHSPPTGGVRMTFTLRGTGPLDMRIQDGTDGLDGLPGFVPRPSDVGIAGSHTSELVLVARNVSL